MLAFFWTALRQPQLSQEALGALIRTRREFLEKEGLPFATSDGLPTVLTSEQRSKVLESWKAEYHSRPEQRALQRRDGDASVGGSAQKVIAGKRSRWCRHLQREFGNKRIAESYVFTGLVDTHALRRVQE